MLKVALLLPSKNVLVWFTPGPFCVEFVWSSLWLHDVSLSVLTSSHSSQMYKLFLLATKLCLCEYWILCVSLRLPCDELVAYIGRRAAYPMDA